MHMKETPECIRMGGLCREGGPPDIKFEVASLFFWWLLAIGED